jgi:hypothetical protein
LQVLLFITLPTFASLGITCHYAYHMKNLSAGGYLIFFGGSLVLVGAADPARVPARLARGMNSASALAGPLVGVSAVLTFLGSALLWANATKVKSGSDSNLVEWSGWFSLACAVAALLARAGPYARAIALALAAMVMVNAMDSAVMDHQKKGLAKAGSVLMWLAQLTTVITMLVIDPAQEEEGFDDMDGPPAFAGAQHVPEQGQGVPPPPQQGGQPNPYLSM